MKVRIVPSLAEPVGQLWKELQQKHTTDGVFNVASPLSSTPLPIYQWIVEHAATFPHWDRVTFVMMDEGLEGTEPPFRYVPTADPASYEGFARRHLLDPLEKTTRVPVGVAMPPLDALPEFSIDIHLLVLALGVSGNYANVMPGTTAETGWHVARLTPEYRRGHTHRNSASYAGATFGEYGMSLGPRQVLAADNVVVIVIGRQKRTLVEQLLSFDSFSPEFPLSVIYHPNATDKVVVYISDDVQAAFCARI